MLKFTSIIASPLVTEMNRHVHQYTNDGVERTFMLSTQQ